MRRPRGPRDVSAAERPAPISTSAGGIPNAFCDGTVATAAPPDLESLRTLVSASETSRRPRGNQSDIVQDLGRLYRLRPSSLAGLWQSPPFLEGPWVPSEIRHRNYGGMLSGSK